MKQILRFFFLASLGTLLTGCAAFTTHSIVPQSAVTPYLAVSQGQSSPGDLTVDITDPNHKSFGGRPVTIVDPVYIRNSGEEIKMTPITIDYGNGGLALEWKSLMSQRATDKDFGLRIPIRQNGKTTVLMGKFERKSHTEIRTMSVYQMFPPLIFLWLLYNADTLERS